MVSTSPNSFIKISSPTVSAVCTHNTVDICWSPDWLQEGQIRQTCHSHAQTPDKLIWCSSSGSPQSARRTAGLGPPPGWSSPPPPLRWCHTVCSEGGVHVFQPCRHKLWPETGETPPSPMAADGQGACPCWSPWWAVAQMWGWWAAEWNSRVNSP